MNKLCFIIIAVLLAKLSSAQTNNKLYASTQVGVRLEISRDSLLKLKELLIDSVAYNFSSGHTFIVTYIDEDKPLVFWETAGSNINLRKLAEATTECKNCLITIDEIRYMSSGIKKYAIPVIIKLKQE